MKPVTFAWDDDKNKENEAKHNVSFSVAQRAFLDPRRVVVEDLTSGATTVSAASAMASSPSGSPTEATPSASTVRATGEREKRYMRNRIKYSDEPMGEPVVIKDFLPRPEELAPKEENVKITISLNKSSVDFFKRKAKEHHTSYQKMIRRLIDWYASQQQKSA